LKVNRILKYGGLRYRELVRSKLPSDLLALDCTPLEYVAPTVADAPTAGIKKKFDLFTLTFRVQGIQSGSAAAEGPDILTQSTLS
jgi:hypothetical protein